MTETKKKIPFFGLEISVSEVPVVKADEQVNRYELEDGTVLKVKSVATAMLRVDGEYLPDGSPIYIVAATPVVSVESSTIKKQEGQSKAN
ncbi:MAG: hypothetical protein ACYDBL_05275 [Candidatus Acidiferrales bacterium]